MRNQPTKINRVLEELQIRREQGTKRLFKRRRFNGRMCIIYNIKEIKKKEKVKETEIIRESETWFRVRNSIKNKSYNISDIHVKEERM